VAELQDFVARHPRLSRHERRGVSTASGIPGYRDCDGQWKRSSPVMLQEFLAKPSAAGVLGRVACSAGRSSPARCRTPAHDAIARLESDGRLRRLVTQNVDGLHQRAGSSDVLELTAASGA
jgi:NAD-dependent SIR2 family protein deacetylase